MVWFGLFYVKSEFPHSAGPLFSRLCRWRYKRQLPDVMSSWRHNSNGQSSSVYVVTSRPTHEALSKQHPTVLPGHVTFYLSKPAPYWCFTKIAISSQLDITAWLEKMLHLREINGILFFPENVVNCAHPHWASTLKNNDFPKHTDFINLNRT